ncbi:MAG TPA: transglycosylase SLT domain-containing protein [Rhizomicrobium sp.]|nr:transglycosylase SLT domain-containing protein [Rhizomicrobium sp.]
MQAEAASLLGAERSSVVTALRNAAAATGSDFHYLLGTAMRESSLKPDARSSSSSAVGLFQFIDQTWLGLVKEHGAQYGLGSFAAAITKDTEGRYHAPATDKQAILNLRKDPDVAALMAGEYAKTTQGQMRTNLGRDVCGGELYAAHFLGPDAACKLIRLAGSDPSVNAVAQFPQAAAANKTVFFHADGAPKSVREVYDWALAQPGAEGSVRVAQLPDITPVHEARLKVAGAQDAEVQMLLASVMNWQPGGGQGLFGNLFGLSGIPGLGNNATPSSALSFGPGLLGLLSDAKNGTS